MFEGERMMEEMKNQELEFELIEDPTPEELNRELTFLANSMARLENMLTMYRKELVARENTLKRTKAIAVIKHKDETPAEYRNAQIELDPDYCLARDRLVEISNILSTATGRMSGYQTQFVAVRKQAELKKIELQQFGFTNN